MFRMTLSELAARKRVRPGPKGGSSLLDGTTEGVKEIYLNMLEKSKMNSVSERMDNW